VSRDLSSSDGTIKGFKGKSFNSEGYNTIDIMANKLRRSPFIVIEGLDRSGKTTQTGRLYARLKEVGTDATLIKFPGKPAY
jgi:hypothetical protein